MSETDDQQLNQFDNTESYGADGEASQTLARAAGSGPVMSEGRAPGAVPGEPDEPGVSDGTGDGDPIAGVTIDPADAAEAVPGDEGPEHPGQRYDR